MKDQKAHTVAQAMVDAVICRYGSPKVLLTDKGSNYLSMTMATVCQSLHIEQVRTTSYHPETDGVSERFGRTLQNALSNYVNEKGTDWDLWLQPCMHALRLSVHRSIGDTPYYVMFGRDCKVPLDHELSLPNELYVDQDDYKLGLVFAMRDAWKSVMDALQAIQDRSKFDYDKRVYKGTADQWIVGQLVDVWTPKRPDEPKKFYKPWKGPYRIVRMNFPNAWTIRLNDPRHRVLAPVHVNNLKHYVESYIPPLLDRAQSVSELAEGAVDLPLPDERAQSALAAPRNDEPEIVKEIRKRKGQNTDTSEHFVLFPEQVRAEPESPLLFGGDSSSDESVPPPPKIVKTKTRKQLVSKREMETLFPPDTLVWAKMKGYPLWPGRVMTKLECPLDILERLAAPAIRAIAFFGDNTYRALNVTKLKLYDESPAQLKLRSLSTTPDFKLAIKQVSEAYRLQQSSSELSAPSTQELLPLATPANSRNESTVHTTPRIF